ncbi:hypothetical protein LPJ72_004756 [Coemansia sp. Benny D160-2]|nr:hypothetical protein LPJ72_004756 [Coemansia sp. Benny D160-2]
MGETDRTNTEGNCVRWVDARDGQIPPNALAQGVDQSGRPLFIARGAYKGGVHPGMAAPHIPDGGFRLSWGGRAHSLNQYQVLCGDIGSTRWEAVRGSSVRLLMDRGVRLVHGGNEADGSTPLFVAKASDNGAVVLGKTSPHFSAAMSYADGSSGAERSVSNYMVLAYQ